MRANRIRNARGQAFLEYIVILGVMVALLVAFAWGGLRDGMNNTLNSTANTMNGATTVVNGVDLTQAKSW